MYLTNTTNTAVIQFYQITSKNASRSEVIEDDHDVFNLIVREQRSAMFLLMC